MREARCNDDFVGGIGFEVQRPKIQADLARNRPDLQFIHGTSRYDVSYDPDGSLERACRRVAKSVPRSGMNSSLVLVFGGLASVTESPANPAMVFVRTFRTTAITV